MYKIIGGDQKEYGPVSADELNRWIAEGRLNAQTLARLEGATEWEPLGSFAEFANALNAQAAARGIPAYSAAPVSPRVFAEQTLAAAGHIRIGDCFACSWRLLKTNFALFYGSALIVMVITWALGRI